MGCSTGDVWLLELKTWHFIHTWSNVHFCGANYTETSPKYQTWIEYVVSNFIAIWYFAILSQAPMQVERQLWLYTVTTLTHELFISHSFCMCAVCVCVFYWFLDVASSVKGPPSSSGSHSHPLITDEAPDWSTASASLPLSPIQASWGCGLPFKVCYLYSPLDYFMGPSWQTCCVQSKIAQKFQKFAKCV